MLGQLLRDPEIGAFGEPVIELTDPGVHQVRREIEQLFQQRHKDDLILLYYSGHGVKDSSGRLYLTAEDTEFDLLGSTAIAADFISEQMEHSRSRRQVLVLDCCYSGAFVSGAKAGGSEAADLAHAFRAGATTVSAQPAGYGRVILTACDEVSVALDNTPLGDCPNSLFTHFLLEGLRGEADLDSDGKISVDEWYNYAYDRIAEVAPQQKPYRLGNQQGVLILANGLPRGRSAPKLPKQVLRRMPSKRRRWSTIAAGASIALIGMTSLLWLRRPAAIPSRAREELIQPSADSSTGLGKIDAAQRQLPSGSVSRVGPVEAQAPDAGMNARSLPGNPIRRTNQRSTPIHRLHQPPPRVLPEIKSPEIIAPPIPSPPAALTPPVVAPPERNPVKRDPNGIPIL
jgi:hypothetical protein